MSANICPTKICKPFANTGKLFLFPFHNHCCGEFLTGQPSRKGSIHLCCFAAFFLPSNFHFIIKTFLFDRDSVNEFQVNGPSLRTMPQQLKHLIFCLKMFKQLFIVLLAVYVVLIWFFPSSFQLLIPMVLHGFKTQTPGILYIPLSKIGRKNI